MDHQGGADESKGSESKSRKSSINKVLFIWWYDHWGSEVLHLLLGALCMVAIAILLKTYEGEVLPLRLPLGFTLGAFIAILAAVAKYALAIPLDSCLNAQKWLWYASSDTPRPMLDFQKFEDASRDPVSAMKLLLRARYRSAASIAAVVVIMSLAIDPFLQQIVNFSQRSSMENRGRVPRVANLTRHVALMTNGVEMVGHQAQVSDAIQFFYLNTTANFNVSAFCPNTECSWPVFNTLGICSSCQDISDQLQFGCYVDRGEWRMNYSSEDAGPGKRASRSCGWFFNASSSEPMLMTGYTADSDVDERTPQALLMRQLNFRDPQTDAVYWNGSLNFKATPNPLANFAVVASPSVAGIYANTTPFAQECVMQTCTKTISAVFGQGVYSERVLSEFRNMTRRVEPMTVTTNEMGLDYLYVQNVTLQPPGQNETFMVGNNTLIKLRFSFDQYLPSYLTVKTGTEIPYLQYANDIPAPAGSNSAQVSCSRWLVPGGIEQTVAEMSTVLTTALRNAVYGEPVFGTGVFETFVEIHWAYFSLPWVVVAMTAMLLCLTVCQTIGAGSAKRSSLFTVLSGVDPKTRGTLGPVTSLSVLRENAKRLLMHLQDDEGRVTMIWQQRAGRGGGEQLPV